MFGFGKKKRTGIHFEILPDHRILVYVDVLGSDGPVLLARMINLIFSRDPSIIDTVIGAVTFCSDKDGWSNQGKEVAQEIINVQTSIDMDGLSTSKRNPIVKPSQVLSNFNKKIAHGGD